MLQMFNVGWVEERNPTILQARKLGYAKPSPNLQVVSTLY